MPDYSHAIVGAGAVGLAIGARLARLGHSVLILEKNSSAGQETSSRNSEVIHAGLYHPPESLRTKLCIRGKELIYEASKKYGVETRNCGKWIVAQDPEQAKYLEKMIDRAKLTGVPLQWVPLDKGKQLEPAIIAKEAILESPTTGIISAHSLMDFYEAELQKYGGELVTHTKVTGLAKASEGYEIECESGGEQVTITADSVINSGGLWAPFISNMLLPKDRHVKGYYAKGNYYSYPLSTPKVNRLVYPCPSNFASLGTHLTIDLANRLKFGPDLVWVDSPTDLEVSAQNMEEAKKAVSQYIDIDLDKLVPDYAGIRPKIEKTNEFRDFVIREEEGFPGFVNLMSIESPGLTSSMAIAEEVEKLCT